MDKPGESRLNGVSVASINDVPMPMRHNWFALLIPGLVLAGARLDAAPPPEPLVEVEEVVYAYEEPKNGAGPMWCSGSTCLVRSGETLFASGIEVVRGAKPLNNCRWVLYQRSADGSGGTNGTPAADGPNGTNGSGPWKRARVSPISLTREPSPIAITDAGHLFLSSHPTLKPGEYSGPSTSQMVIFQTADVGGSRTTETPAWDGDPQFTEHSYRSLAADGPNGELLLLSHSKDPWGMHWTFRDGDGQWSAKGSLRWPWGATYERPQPIRIAYPNVLVRDREAHLCGVSDIIEPNSAWKAYKKELTGQDWDYDFRRLYYTWSPDIRLGQWQEWTEIASREATGGWITPGDLWLGRRGFVHLVWSERAIDERLRDKFFPTARQSHAINYARLRSGQVIQRRTLAIAEEGLSREQPSAPRFQATPDGRLFVFYYVNGTNPAGQPVSENRLIEVLEDGTVTDPVRVPLQRPLNSYFTATVRGGSPPSYTLDLLGTTVAEPLKISYARVQLR